MNHMVNVKNDIIHMWTLFHNKHIQERITEYDYTEFSAEKVFILLRPWPFATSRGFPTELGNIQIFPNSAGKPRVVAIMALT